MQIVAGDHDQGRFAWTAGELNLHHTWRSIKSDYFRDLPRLSVPMALVEIIAASKMRDCAYGDRPVSVESVHFPPELEEFISSLVFRSFASCLKRDRMCMPTAKSTSSASTEGSRLVSRHVNRQASHMSPAIALHTRATRTSLEEMGTGAFTAPMRRVRQRT